MNYFGCVEQQNAQEWDVALYTKDSNNQSLTDWADHILIDRFAQAKERVSQNEWVLSRSIDQLLVSSTIYLETYSKYYSLKWINA